ncbi:MAG: protease inhibitor I42 family protein [Chloroflexia bacterium]|nr:protease inhibitor I42 family protein [Chloroflexia bacterium]
MSTLPLTKDDNGRTVESRQGDEIVLRLPENATTGYRWHIDRADEQFEQTADSYHPEPELRFGSGGVREFRFRARAAGTARLELKHWQAWEGEGSVTDRFAVEIQIVD